MPARASCFLLSVATLAGGVFAQTVVTIGQDEIFDPDDLFAGSFGTQSFELGPDTTFRILDGGEMRLFPFTSGLGFLEQIDFLGSRVEVESGGSYFGNVVVEGVDITLTGGVASAFLGLEATLTVLDGSLPGIAFDEDDPGTVIVAGGEFRLNGAPLVGTPPALLDSDTFTATLETGNVITIALREIPAGSLQVVATPVPPVATDPVVLDSDSFPFNGIRPTEVLTVVEGGSLLSDFNVVEGTLNVDGGEVDTTLRVVGGTVNINDGVVERPFFFSGSHLELTGGMVDFNLTLDRGSTATVRGGGFGIGLFAGDADSLELVGNEYRVDGTPVSTLPTELAEGSVVSGTLSDGSVVILTDLVGDVLPANTTITEVPLEPADAAPMTITSGTGPKGLRPGQSLWVASVATLGDNFAAAHASLRLTGNASIGNSLETSFTDLDISGGSIDSFASFHGGGDIRISGGVIGSFLTITQGPTVEITGGSFDALNRFDADTTISAGRFGSFNEFSAQTTISRGTFGSFTSFLGDADATITGGTFGRSTSIEENAQVRIEDGEFEDSLRISGDASVVVLDGSFGDDTRIQFGGTVALFGGTFGDGFDSDGSLTLAGATVGDELTVGRGSTFRLDAGQFGVGLQLEPDSTTVIAGLAFAIDGVPITNPGNGATVVLEERDARLTGKLAGGQPFELELNSTRIDNLTDWVAPDASLTLAFQGDQCSLADVAEPFGIVDLDDLDAFIVGFLAGETVVDLTLPVGIVDLDDLDVFIESFLAGCP